MEFEKIFSQLARMCAGKKLEGYTGAPVTALLEITGDQPGFITVTASAQGVELSPAKTENTDASVTMSSKTASDLLTGKLKPMQTVMTGAVKVRGNMTHLMGLMKYIKR